MFARIGSAAMLTVSLVFSGALWASGDDNEQTAPPVVVEEASANEELQNEDLQETQEQDGETADSADAPVVVTEPPATKQSFVVYIMRHAEKEDSELDPELTRDGYRRADGLAQMLSQADIEAIYSTYYRRSVSTALPLARALSVPIQFYKADASEQLLQKIEEEAVNALVIGHSNTVPDLLQGMGATGDELPEQMSEEQYGDLFQLFIDSDNETPVRTISLVAPLILDAR
ncbi:hypothetical protein CWE12_00135 [Aliidiomarina sedimenti]|uniref:Histidine phosphatase family protein n=1 Tax=Aliidiomarina sedimenti TaxID=1933879 RepID=A0ABY0C138_9GAMM|nr:histidine phosphatase family protein [Aliidiomarina sedimenti]RUO31449.1 hypothetical protein CWE12_00135 [Aliidiomarina sedimenti]